MAKKRLNRTSMIPVRLDGELVKGLDIIALKNNKYRSELIREAVKDLITKYDFFSRDKKDQLQIT